MTLANLPFSSVWALDFEYVARTGETPVPVCMVGRELRTGQTLRLWQDQLERGRPPFPVDDDTLFVAYMAAAEVSCFLALDWPVPTRVLDLYAEFRAYTNGVKLDSSGLLGALSWHGISSITKDEKNTMRDLVLRGGPWSSAERAAILDYCQTDVDPLGPLLARMLPTIRATRQGLGQALLRGRYMTAVARMEQTGVPVDVALLARLRDGWQDLKLDLVADLGKDFGVYDGATFKTDLFEKWLANEGIAWPYTDAGRPCLDRDTFHDMSRLHPRVATLADLRHALSDLRLESLAVGADGR